MTHPEPDPRMVHFAGHPDEGGLVGQITQADLQRIASQWQVTEATPGGIADLLRTARNLFIHSYYVYEFAVVGVAWSLLAVEGGLKARLGLPNKPFVFLIDEAIRQSLLPADMAEQLHAGRMIRNGFSHPDSQTVWPFGMSAPSLAASHEVVALLYPDHPE